MCFWQLHLKKTPKNKQKKDYICGVLNPEPAHCHCWLFYLIRTVPNVECLKKCLGLGGFIQSTLQFDQKTDFPSKQLNTCCKIRSYIQAFIKWLEVDVV